MLNGLIMSGDTPVARFSGRAVTPILPSRAPLCFRNGGDLEGRGKRKQTVNHIDSCIRK